MKWEYWRNNWGQVVVVREEGGEERWQMNRGAESEGREGARQHGRYEKVDLCELVVEKTFV